MSYFDELFGSPQLIKRENWDGKEELLDSVARPVCEQLQHWLSKDQKEEQFTDYEIVE